MQLSDIIAVVVLKEPVTSPQILAETDPHSCLSMRQTIGINP